MSKANTLAHYQTLSEHSDALGCVLPELNTGRISITSRHCQQQELANLLAPWLNAAGWYQTTADTGLGMPEQLGELLEGQWYQADSSLHLNLLHGDNYQLVEIKNSAPAQSSTAAQCYSEQMVWLRPQLKGQHNALRYRFWWQQQNGAWQPIMQQFAGFALLEEK